MKDGRWEQVMKHFKNEDKLLEMETEELTLCGQGQEF